MVYRKPGTPIPEDCDFWWSMWHDKRYHSFVDSFVDKPLTSATYAEAGKTEGPRVRTRPHPNVTPFQTILRCMPSCWTQHAVHAVRQALPFLCGVLCGNSCGQAYCSQVC